MTDPQPRSGFLSLFARNAEPASPLAPQPREFSMPPLVSMPSTNKEPDGLGARMASTGTQVKSSGSAIEQMLSDIYEKTRIEEEGSLADYIPELAKVSPGSYGIALATSRGRLHTIGDADVEFTIQSTSKALTYCLALELAGRQRVFSRVGVEPSGDPFNAIEFSPVTRRPYNPMVNVSTPE